LNISHDLEPAFTSLIRDRFSVFGFKIVVMKQKFVLLLLTRLIIFRVAGGKATVFRESWYRDARHSPVTPPGWVFGVAWPFNYATSSWAAAIFATKVSGAERDRGIFLWLLQAVVTSVWTRVFGDLKRADWALQDLILSWLLGIATARKFAQGSPAGFWMIPPLCLADLGNRTKHGVLNPKPRSP
jgi:tryptophan-rich sensory protein